MSTDRKCSYCGETADMMFFDPRQRAYKGPVDNFFSCRKCWSLKDVAYYKRIDQIKK